MPEFQRTAEPIAVRVTRYRCPFCARSASGKGRSREHIARCWHNPAAQGCKTCKHFETYDGEYGDSCAVGVDLSGRPECGECKGGGLTFSGEGVSECGGCGGDGAPVKAGPIVHCEKWEGTNA